MGTTTSTTSSGPQTFGISVSNNQFSPANRTITVGDTIVWSFTEGTHTTTSNGGLWNSGSKSSGTSFSHQFNSAGSFGYFCSFHSSMTGTITVNP
ncbi:MAG: plastocyanin/azurin family copper-binding protein [Acidimicrobiia bacterium]